MVSEGISRTLLFLGCSTKSELTKKVIRRRASAPLILIIKSRHNNKMVTPCLLGSSAEKKIRRTSTTASNNHKRSSVPRIAAHYLRVQYQQHEHDNTNRQRTEPRHQHLQHTHAPRMRGAEASRTLHTHEVAKAQPIALYSARLGKTQISSVPGTLTVQAASCPATPGTPASCGGTPWRST